MELKNLNRIDIKKQLKKNYVDFSKDSLTSKQQPVLASTKFAKKIKGSTDVSSGLHQDMKARFIKNYEKGLLYDSKKGSSNVQKTYSNTSLSQNRIDTAETKIPVKESSKQCYFQNDHTTKNNTVKIESRIKDSTSLLKAELRSKESRIGGIKVDARLRDSITGYKSESRTKDTTSNILKSETRPKDPIKQKYLHADHASQSNIIKTEVSKNKSSVENRNLSISSNNTKVSEIGSIKKREQKSVKENVSPNIYNFEKNEKSIQIANSNYNSIRNSIGAKSNNYDSIYRSSSGGNTYNHAKPNIQRSSLGVKANIKPPESISTNLFGSTAQTTQSKKGRCNSAYNVKKLIPTSVVSNVGSIKSFTGMKTSALKSYTSTAYNSK